MLVVVALAGCAGGRQPASLDPMDWRQYSERFIETDGRVRDDGQHGFSHSEGQGYGMVLAVAFDDREAFDRIWKWTRKHLRREDGLHAWKYNPRLARVTDSNNATDGDLMIAWALLRAAARWGEERYRREALAILDALAPLVRRIGDGLYLMPGAKGFTRGYGAMLNPSYFLFPAWRDFVGQHRAVDWKAIDASALALVRQARFGIWRLPADWVDVRADGSIRPARTRPAEFGYDAIRLPLYLAWVGERDLLEPFERFWAQFTLKDAVPDRVGLDDDRVHLEPGFSAVRMLAALVRRLRDPHLPMPSIDWTRNPGYYDASLMMLARLAASESRPEKAR
ncbi:MAG: glycosyl hydrolase family 8 [Mariprofundaceae bacterium]